MKTRNRVFAVIGSLALSGAALAQGGMGMHGGMGMIGTGDAKVTKEEFLKRAERRFARIDVNKDGVIDASDRAARRKRMRDCMGMMDGAGMGMMGGGMQGGGAGAADQDHEAHHPKP